MPKKPIDQLRLTELADAVLDGVSAIGGLDEIEVIADDGWPEDVELTNDSPELREMIQERASAIIQDSDDDEDEDDEEEATSETDDEG